MTSVRALLPTLLAAGVLALLPAGGAYAEGGTIAHVEPTAGGFSVLVSVPEGAEVSLEDPVVTVDGTAVTATAAPATSQVRRTAVLAIDTSNSMAGARFEGAKAAALAFLDAVPDDVLVGIVSFAGDVTPGLAPTRDRGAAETVVRELSLSRQTRLYQGVLASVAMAGTEGQRSLLVLSDGADTSTTDLSAVTAAVQRAGILVDVLALSDDVEAAEALRKLAAAGGGRLITATPEALTAALAEKADVLTRQVLVSAEVPPGEPGGATGTEATVEVTLQTSSEPITASAFTTVRDEVPSTSRETETSGTAPGWDPPPWVRYAGVAAFGIGLVLLLVLLVPRRPGPSSIEERIARYTAHPDSGQAPARPEAEQALTQARDAAAQVLERNQGLEARISLRLDGAGSSLKSSEWLLVQTGILLAAGLVGLLLGRGSLLVGLVFVALGIVGPWIYLGVRRTRRRKAFNSHLPETLQLMSGSLSAGLSLAQSIDTIVREGTEPVSSEFRRVLVETRLGVSLEDALDGVAERFESKDFAWVVMAIRIQRQVGGNLAELLDTVSATMREREYMRRQVAALSAEGKLSAIVLGLLPPLFLLYLLVAQRDYVMPLFTDVRGIVLLVAAGLLLSLGIFWMSKLVKVEV